MLNVNEKLYKKLVKNCVKVLKKNNDESTEAKISMILRDTCSQRGNLKTEQYLYEMRMYITYLGFLDALIESEIESNKQQSDEINIQYNVHNSFYGEYRDKLIYIIKNATDLIQPIPSYLSNVEEIINKVPSKDYLGTLKYENGYNSMKDEFVKAYDAGFNQAKYINFEFFNYNFKKGYSQIVEHKAKNEQKVAEMKLKRQKDY